METTSTNGKENLPLSAHPKKLVRFAEIYAKGIYSAAEAAREAGYKPSTAHKCAYAWIGRTRQDSEYPILWDYYEKLRKENLREFDVNADSIARELALIGFADLTRFIDLPSREYDKKMQYAREVAAAVNAVESYRIEIEIYNAEVERQDKQQKGRKKKLTPPPLPTDRQYILASEYSTWSDEHRNEVMIWQYYRSGSIRLKNREEIPVSLLPCLAEISETKEGIRVKLHDKISALDKLAKWQKMYEDKADEGGEAVQVKEINIHVNGSRSTLKITQDEGEKAA